MSIQMWVDAILYGVVFIGLLLLLAYLMRGN